MNIQDVTDRADEAAAMMSALAHPARLLVLCRLMEGELSVGTLAHMVDLSPSALSQHLAKLRALKLVKTRKEAQTVYYSLSGHEVRAILETLHGLYCNTDA